MENRTDSLKDKIQRSIVVPREVEKIPEVLMAKDKIFKELPKGSSNTL